MKVGIWTIGCLLLSGALGVWADREAATIEPAHQPDVADRALTIQRQFLLEDHEPLRSNLASLQRSLRTLMPEEADHFGSPAVAFSRGIQRGLSATRERVIAGDYEDARTQFIWVLDACVGCHQATREAGAGPAQPVR